MDNNEKLDTCPYCGSRLLIKNTMSDDLYFVCPDCGYSLKDPSGRKIEKETSCSNCCSDCSGCQE